MVEFDLMKKIDPWKDRERVKEITKQEEQKFQKGFNQGIERAEQLIDEEIEYRIEKLEKQFATQSEWAQGDIIAIQKYLPKLKEKILQKLTALNGEENK